MSYPKQYILNRTTNLCFLSLLCGVTGHVLGLLLNHTEKGQQVHITVTQSLQHRCICQFDMSPLQIQCHIKAMCLFVNKHVL